MVEFYRKKIIKLNDLKFKFTLITIKKNVQKENYDEMQFTIKLYAHVDVKPSEFVQKEIAYWIKTDMPPKNCAKTVYWAAI